jgi:acetolactate synthase-1/2/3 large subunit
MAERNVSGHGGTLAIAAAQAHGVDTMFTLSGGHVFPLYDAAVHAEPSMRIVDVRHEQTAVFAAEGTAKLSRRPGFAVVTAGPGVTNAVSAVTTAHFNGSPVLVLAGRAPAEGWGRGGLQELDHPPLLAPVTKRAATIGATGAIAGNVDAALALAASPHRGPVFLDVAMDTLFGQAADVTVTPTAAARIEPDPADVDVAAEVLAAAERPVLVLGSGVWTGGAEDTARRCAETLGLPAVANGMARGVLPPSAPELATRARSASFKEADLVVVVGTPLDFRLGFGAFGDPASPARVVHVVDAPDQLAGHQPLAAGVAGDLTMALNGLTAAVDRRGPERSWAGWRDRLAGAASDARERDADVLEADAVPIHPARLYGELRRLLDDDAVVIGDGGDFVSYAGKYLEPARPGGWLDPGPYGCLGTGLGYAIAARLARPSSQVVCLLGDGAAGFSLMDADTLARHRLPVVIVCGNNGAWGLEKHPMRALYGYDVAAELAPARAYDEVVRALGGAGETVTEPAGIGPALRRGFAAGTPYLINLITDPEVAYPRSTVLA